MFTKFEINQLFLLSAVLIMKSGINNTVVMKGKQANKYLCVNNESKVYASVSITIKSILNLIHKLNDL